MKRTLSLALAGIMVLSAISVPVAAQASVGQVEIVEFGSEGHPSFVVQYENGTYDSLEAWAESSPDHSIQSNDPDRNSAVVSGPRWRVQTPGLIDNPRVAALAGTPAAERPLEGRDYVTDVSPNFRHSLPATPEAVSEDEYSAPANDYLVRGGFETSGIAWDDDANETTIGAVASDIGADNVTADGTEVDVAVLDTGLNVRNGSDDDLFGTRIAGAKNFVTNETAVARYDFDNVSDGNGHGSWVAGSIAANASNDSYDGIAPDATLYIGKTLDDDGSGSTADIVDGIHWAEEKDTDILSMSLGSPTYDEALADAIRHYLAGNGTVVYIAVGNSRQSRPAQIASPSDVPEAGVVSVAATNATPPDNAGPAYFSQTGFDNGYSDFSGGTTRGQRPDVAMPGMEITVATFSESDIRKNTTLSGTSMATPIEAARGAIGLDANPSWENDTETMVGWVTNTTDPIPGAAVQEVGAGMGNVSRLANANANNQTQEEAMNDGAESRNSALHSFGGDIQFRAFRQIQAVLA